MRVLHFYTMKQEPERVRAVGPRHAEYWRRVGAHRYQGGPFDDRSGGLITFEVDSREEAERLIAADPFVRGSARVVLGQAVGSRFMKEARYLHIVK